MTASSGPDQRAPSPLPDVRCGHSGSAPDTPARSVLEDIELLVVCTGNAARSVMVGFMLEHLGPQRDLSLRVVTAGTHTVEGQPMGLRTRNALTGIEELAVAPVSRHRSRQLAVEQIRRADLVIGMEADHVRFVRRHHGEAAARTATIRRFAGQLPPGPAPIAERVRSMDLAAVEPDDAEDVADPAGGDETVYRACAEELWALSALLVRRL